MTNNIWLLYSTFPSRDEAVSLSRLLLEERLIACANIVGGVTSVYRWQGELQEENEVLLIAKTTAAQVDAAIARISSAHSYEVPCITAWPLAKGHAPFRDWIGQETRRES